MSEPEPTSTKDDPELKAMLAIVRYLGPLDRAACSRVLSWGALCTAPVHMADGDLDAFTRFTEALAEAAQTIGDVTPLEIIRFVDAVRAEDTT